MDNPFSFEPQELSDGLNSDSSGFDTHKAAFDSVSTIRFIYGIVRQFLAYFKVFEGTKIAPIARLAGTGAEFLFGAIFTLIKPNTTIKEKLIAIGKVAAITVGFAVGGFLTLFLGPLAPYIAGAVFAVSTLVELGICAYDLHKTRVELKKEKANLHSLKERLEKTKSDQTTITTSEIKHQKSSSFDSTINDIEKQISYSERKIATLTTKRHQQGLAVVGCVLSTIAATVAFAAIFAFPPIGLVLTAVALGVGVAATSCFVAKKVWELVTNFKNKESSEQQQSNSSNQFVKENKGFLYKAKKFFTEIFIKKQVSEERQHLISDSSREKQGEPECDLGSSTKNIISGLTDVQDSLISDSCREEQDETKGGLGFSTKDIIADPKAQDPSPGNSPYGSREASPREVLTEVTSTVGGTLFLNKEQSIPESHNSGCAADARQGENNLLTGLNLQTLVAPLAISNQC